MNDDDRLLEALSQALAPPPAEPSDEEIAALRRAVTRRFRARQVRPWWRPRAVTLLAAAALCTATAAAVAGSPVSGPVRTLARAVGLPVESAALADTRAAVKRLRTKLEARDREGVTWALEDVRSRIDALTERDRRALGEETATLFLEAEAFVKPPAPKPAPKPAPRRIAAPPAAAPPAECREVDLEDPESPPPPLPMGASPAYSCSGLICVVLRPEDEDKDEPEAPHALPGEAQPDTDEDDDEADRERERAEREAERAEHQAEREAERAANEAERAEQERARAEQERERAERERERAQHEAERAQHEAERAQHEAERAQQESERAARQSRDKVHEKDETCEDTARRPPPPEPEDDDDD